MRKEGKRIASGARHEVKTQRVNETYAPGGPLRIPVHYECVEFINGRRADDKSRVWIVSQTELCVHLGQCNRA